MKHTIIFFLVIIFVSCDRAAQDEEKDLAATDESITVLTAEQIRNAGIKTVKPEKKVISSTIKVNGSIDVPPQNLVSVSLPLGGYLKSTHLLPGMHVKKGELLAVLEDQQYIQLQQDYLTTKARLEAAEAEFHRQEQLNQTKAASDKSVQQSRAEFKSLKISLQALGEKLKLINIDPSSLNEETLTRQAKVFSPFDGFVSRVNVNIGKYITPSDVMFELVNPQDIHLNLRVFEKDLTQLSIGQKLLAYTNSDRSKKYKCEIILISKDIGPDHTAEVHCHFDDYDKSLIPGMYMMAEIETATHDAWTIPTSTIVVFDGKQYVFVEEGKQSYRMTEIQSGKQTGNETEIMGPASLENSIVVSEGAYTLLMSLKNRAEE